MDYVAFAAFAVLVLGGICLLGQLLRQSGRNRGSHHGGGWEGTSEGVEFGDHP